MKVIFTVFFCCWVLSGHAQTRYSTKVIIKVEHLDKSVQYDTLSERMAGRRFVYCIIPDQFETIKTAPVDTLAYAQKRVLSYEFTPPQYDSLVETIEVRPAYSFYEIDKKAKRPKGAIFIPPTCEIERRRVIIDSTRILVGRFKGLEMGTNDADCIGFVVIDLPKNYFSSYQRRLKTAAVLIQKRNGQTITDTLKLSSPYLKEIKVNAYTLQKTTYSISKSMTIKVKSTSLVTPNNITGRRLLREGMLSEMREYIVCGGTVSPTIRAIQKSLRRRGYWVKNNNIMDNRTKRALIIFQKRHHLPIGNLNYQTIKALNAERFMKNEEWTGGNKMDYMVKNVAFDNLDSFDDLIFLQALPDKKIAELAYVDIKAVKARRKALNIKEVKQQVVLFKEYY
jgi:peptidoglycan hydrolase-like protein with peptidoglycan-binding domain